MPAEVDFFVIGGGLDEVSPPLGLKPGMAITAKNFECDTYGGYRRVAGYERFDGRPSPHSQSYYVLPATITGTVTAGATLTGLTSGATAYVLATEASAIILAKVTGTYQNGESLQISGVTEATCTGLIAVNSGATSALHAQYKNLAADSYRLDIGAVPGSGQIRGVWYYKDVVYAFRDNAGGTACVMHKSTGSGWSAITFGEEVSFSNANLSVGDGDTLTQGSVTATISRVVVQTGTLASGTNTGRLIITGRAGGAFTGAAATSTGGGSLTLSGASTAITLLPGGTYEFITHNFGGSTVDSRMYGVDGVNRGFEFDGTVFVPISTGMVSDTPEFIAAHKNHLFFSFGSSLQHSGIGNPYSWSPITGAAEIALGDTITGQIPLPGSESSGALMITTRGRAYALYGNSSADWNLVVAQSDAGARAYTIQTVGQAFVVDDRGLMRIGQSQAFGNFEQAALSHSVRPTLSEMMPYLSASSFSRERNQYRVYSSDGNALYLTLQGAESAGIMPIVFPNPVVRICSIEESTGTERIFFGSTNGYVYESDVGTSFDGEDIDSLVSLAFVASRSPRQRKRYRRGAVEVQGRGGYTEVSIGHSVGYESLDSGEAASATLSTARWDFDTFDQFYFDARGLQPLGFELTGAGENVSIFFYSTSDYIEPFTLTGVFIHYLPGRQVR